MMTRSIYRNIGTGLALALVLNFSRSLRADDTAKADMVPLQLKLPSSVAVGTPPNTPSDPNIEPISTVPPTVMIPKDARNIAPQAKITSSDKSVTHEELAKLTDGDKDAEQDSTVELRKGLQWVQFDFGSPKEIDAIAVWHGYDTPKIFRSVIVQTADDADFTEDVHTLFNNDRDNSAGFGVGTNRQYFETFHGRVIDAKGVQARYVRLYSHGSTEGSMNAYIEVEIYGRPVK